MIPNFSAFAAIVASSFQRIAKSGSVFVTDAKGDDLYAAYLAAFPAGTDPLFKKRTANKIEREKLLSILAEKQEGKLSALSEKELQKRINELGE